MRILMTGFEPFLGYPANSSWDGLVRMLAPDLARDVAIERLPVEFARTGAALREAIAKHRPQAVISLGMHNGAKSSGRDLRTFYVERYGYNLMRAAVADNAGVIHDGAPVSDAFPMGAALPSTLPVDALAGALQGAGVSVAFSTDPGRYLCNLTFFTALSGCGAGIPPASEACPKDAGQRPAPQPDTGSTPLAAFVHVPPHDAIAPGAPALDDLARACAALARAAMRDVRI